MAANAFYELGEIRRRMGDLEGAQAAFAQAYEFGLEPQPGLALVRLAQGDTAAASTAIARALTHPQANTQRAGGARRQPADRLRRARFLPAQVEIALAAGDLVTARTATDELETIAADYDTKALHAHACCARSAVARADEDLERAMAAATDARALWQELDMPYETAHAHMSPAAIHQAAGDDEAAQIELRTAHALFKRLRADRDRSAAATQLDKDFRIADPTLRLSARELDVLRLVANGLTDTEIARRLFLSPHTVHRHLANIRAKTNQPSRAAAVAQAARLGLI